MSIITGPDVDLREEMCDLIKQTRYNVLLQRTSKKIRCRCFNHKYTEADSKCPICLGTGWLFKFEKLRSFKQDVDTTAEGAILFTQVGELHHSYKVFYFEHDTHPKVKDYIWEVQWAGNKPTKLNELFKIKEVSDQRGENGKIEYYTILAQREAIDKDFKNMHIGKAWRDA